MCATDAEMPGVDSDRGHRETRVRQYCFQGQRSSRSNLQRLGLCKVFRYSVLLNWR